MIISGTSAGAGKDTLLKLFLKKHPDWVHPPSTTTRPPRFGETEGVDYFFIDKQTFEDKLRRDEFLEVDFHAGNWYGTLQKPIQDLLDTNAKLVLRKDVNGSIELKNKIPQAIVVFIDVERPEVLEQRIRQRDLDSEAEIQARLKLAQQEQALKKHFDHVVINHHNRPEEALATIEKAVGL